MSYESFIAMRHLRSTRRTFLSTLTILAITGVALGVASLTAVVSVAGGFVDSFRDRVLSVNAHVVVMKYGMYFSEYGEVIDRVEQLEDVVAAGPFILHEMLVTSPDSRSRPGALVKGVDIDAMPSLIDPEHLRIEGALESLAIDPDGTLAIGAEAGQAAPIPVALGAALARRLQADVGEEITLISPLRGGRSAGFDPMNSTPLYARARVAAILETGFYDYDNRLVLADYRALQALIDRGDVVNGLDVRINDAFESEAALAQLDQLLPPGRYQTMDWAQINRNLFKSLHLQKLALTVVMSLLVVVASFVIVCVLVMLVLEKRREIAILRSMGAPRGGVVRIFLLEGVTIGAIGTALGLALGRLACWIIARIDFGLELEVYRIDTLPVSVRWEEFAIAGLGAMLIALLVTLYPSWRAAKISPVDGLRYD